MSTDRDRDAVSGRQIEKRPEVRRAESRGPDTILTAPAHWLHLQRTAGNSAVANSIALLRHPPGMPGAAVQRTVVGPAGILKKPAEIFEILDTRPNDEWEVAAAQSLIDDHIVRDITKKTALALEGLQSSLTERVKLAQAVISIANNGILTKEDRERKNIRAQQSIDAENESSVSKISLSQTEIERENDATQVAGLLEHQAMSVRMEKYLEEGGRQVPERWLRSESFRPAEVKEAIEVELDMSLEEYNNEVRSSPMLSQLLYRAVMKLRGKSPTLAKLLAERASNSAIFVGSTGAATPAVQETFKAMGLDQPKLGSHEARVSHSMPANALEFILLPRCLYAFNSLLRAHIKNDLNLHYIDGTHTVKVSWVPIIGLPQVSFEIESPNWQRGLEEILKKEKRIFAHVTRPLKEPAPQPPQTPQFMTSKAMKPLSAGDLLLASKVMGKNRAAKLSSLGML